MHKFHPSSLHPAGIQILSLKSVEYGNIVKMLFKSSIQVTEKYDSFRQIRRKRSLRFNSEYANYGKSSTIQMKI